MFWQEIIKTFYPVKTNWLVICVLKNNNWSIHIEMNKHENLWAHFSNLLTNLHYTWFKYILCQYFIMVKLVKPIPYSGNIIRLHIISAQEMISKCSTLHSINVISISLIGLLAWFMSWNVHSKLVQCITVRYNASITLGYLSGLGWGMYKSSARINVAQWSLIILEEGPCN
jgi:hypothetical protein